jgi:hypothetical protein
MIESHIKVEEDLVARRSSFQIYRKGVRVEPPIETVPLSNHKMLKRKSPLRNILVGLKRFTLL